MDSDANPPESYIERLYQLFISHPSISTDSRSVRKGDIFFALRGASFDGNLFVRAALDKGVAAAVTDSPEVCAIDERCILVDDTLTALQHLAARHRSELKIPVLALTGSNGKTTTKELLAAVLSQKFRVKATEGNLNNHIGVPLTILSLDSSVEMAIVEMGASHCGEIATLCSIAHPDYGLITNIGRAHLEGFGGAEGIRCGKGELFDYLSAHGGTAFVPDDDPMLCSMAAERSALKKIGYRYMLATGIENRLAGDYNRFNIAAAVAVGEYFGVPYEDMRRAIANYIPENNRSQRMVTDRNRLIADCYNANPSSMAAAIENFAHETVCDTDGRELRKVMILGDMLELGQWSLQEHRKIVDLIVQYGIDTYFVGENFCRALEDVDCDDDQCLLPFADRQALSDYFDNEPLSSCFILVKGSHSMGLDSVIDIL